MKAIKPIMRAGHYYIRRRVPSRYESVEPRSIIQLCLFTDSLDIAQRKAGEVWAQMIEAWEAKLAGHDPEGEGRLDAARELAHARGYRFLYVNEIAKLPIERLLERVESVKDRARRIDMKEADAALGLPSTPVVMAGKAVDVFYDVAAEDLKDKNADQIRRHKNPRIAASTAFIEVVGDKPLAEVTTADMFLFRKWLVDRVIEGEVKADTANKNMSHLISVWRRVLRSKGLSLPFSTEGLMLKSDKDKDDVRPPFSREWIQSKIMAPSVLSGLNDDARLILLGMINTGYRPSEGAGLLPCEIKLEGNVPHIIIQKNSNRTLKTKYSKRKIPLAGVSLEAFREGRYGFPRYASNSATLSATVNKYLAAHGLLQTPDHSMYSLRHSLEDRMLTAGVDERVRRDMLGHALNRERYGQGGDLEFLLGEMQKVAI